jgi:vitamin B12 transporter
MKKEKKVWAITLIVLWWLAPNQTNAQQDSVRLLNEVVVTGTRFELPVKKSGKTIYQISESQLKNNSGRNLSDLLNNVAGVQMDGNFNTPGTNINYYVRGARNKQTLILLDGVPMNDPSGIDAFYDLRYVALNQLKNVEILQGGLSTLYGSSAAAGVINIQSKTVEGAGIHGSFDVNAGSWNTFGQNLNVNGKQGKLSFQLMGNNYSSEGFSSALDKNNTGTFDKDGIQKKNGFVKVSYQFSSHLTLDTYFGYDWFDAKYDNGAFQDGNNSQVQSQSRVGLKGKYSYANGSIQLTAQQLINNREFKSSFPSSYDGSNQFMEAIHTHRLSSVLKILSGVSFQQLKFGQKSGSTDINKGDTTKFTIVDPYTSLFLDLPSGFQLHAGARLNTHSVYGSKVVYNVNPSWNIISNEHHQLKILGSISTSFITPSLYQLYSPYGNKKLNPEEDLNYEYGVSFSANQKLTINAVNFFREEKNPIGFSALFKYTNLASMRLVKGVTVDGSYHFSDHLQLSADFTYQTTDDYKTFYRIPNQKWGMGVTFKPLSSTQVTALYRHTGNRKDLYYDASFNANEVTMDAFDLVDLSASHEFLKRKMMVYGSVNNLFDTDFVGIYGFTTQGRNFVIGLKYQF